MAVHVASAFGFPLNFQLDAVCAVHKPRAAPVHQRIRNEAHINNKPEPIAGVKLGHIHVLGFVHLFRKEAAGLFQRVFGFDAVVEKHVGRAVDRDADFRQIREDVFFRISGARIIRFYKKEENGFERSSLGVDFDVEPRVAKKPLWNASRGRKRTLCRWCKR